VIFLAVIVFQPINYQIKHFVDRLFSQGEYRYQQTINDLSAENKKLFTSLLQADKMASLGTLAAGMAHEIKNPLAALKGMTQVLPENMDNREFLAQYQAVVVRQIDRINNIVETLLKYGQPGKLTVSQYNLNKMVIEVITLFKNQCQKQGIMVEQKLADLPLINGDTEQLTQVLTNLILNAIQAMPAGGQLAIRTQIVESRTQIQVEDTGLGISEERLARIFDPFYTTKEDGSGMG
jgi:signal transduction histidine kinase